MFPKNNYSVSKDHNIGNPNHLKGKDVFRFLLIGVGWKWGLGAIEDIQYHQGYVKKEKS